MAISSSKDLKLRLRLGQESKAAISQAIDQRFVAVSPVLRH